MTTAQEICDEGYEVARPLPSGEWLAVQQMLFTAGLYIVVDRDRWRTQFCYEHHGEAMAAWQAWNGEGDPPGPWIKQKPEGRLNPTFLADARKEFAGGQKP